MLAERGSGMQAAQSARAHLLAIDVAPIAERSGQIMRNHLLDRFTALGQQRKPLLYRLEITLNESERQAGFQSDETATWATMMVTGTFSLISLESKKSITSGSERSSASYSIQQTTEDAYALSISRRNARERALQQMSDAIFTRLSLFFQN